MKDNSRPALFLLLAATLLLAACGVKPGAVMPPEGEAAPPFPRTYPAP